MTARLLLIVLLLAVPAWAQTSYPADLVRVIDGDTYVLRVELGFQVSITVPIRLSGIDTPERFTPEGRSARAFAEARLRSGRIVVTPTGARTFERYVAAVTVDGKDLAGLLRAAGHVKTVGAPQDKEVFDHDPDVQDHSVRRAGTRPRTSLLGDRVASSIPGTTRGG